MALAFSAFSQQKMLLSLNDALHLAQTQSLQSFLAKHTYLVGYWQYKSFQADYLPALTFNSQLISYDNANQLRYNSVTNTEDFIRTETLNSSASLVLLQNVGLTGGTFYVQSDLDRTQNLGDNSYTQFASRPFRIGYQQKLFGYNQFKWERKTEPERYELAMRQYLQDVEQNNGMACDYFFNLAMAEINLEMAAFNYHHTDTLLQLAHQRFNLGTIQKEELLELELSLNNASIRLKEARMQYRKNKEQFITFLRLPTGVEVEILLPDALNMAIPEAKALDLALERNAYMVEQQLQLIGARRNVAQTRAENRFQANLNVSYGINRIDGYYDYTNNAAVDGDIAGVYSSPFDDYQTLGVDVSIPILDWGRRKGRYQMAKSQQEVTRIGVEQAAVNFQQEVITKVLEFNLQYDKVQAAAKSDTLAMDSYQLTSLRFIRGNADVLKLTSSQTNKDNARLQYIRALYQFWSDYYTVRELTLYNFKTNSTLEEDFDEMLGEF